MSSGKCRSESANKMEDERILLINLFEKRLALLLQQNPGYSRFRQSRPEKKIENALAREAFDKEDIIDLGFLVHLRALKLRLALYRHLTPFSILDFRKDLIDIINIMHVYERRGRSHSLFPHVQNSPRTGGTELPCLLEISDNMLTDRADNPELYSNILDMLGSHSGITEPDVPEEIIVQMQEFDKKRMYRDLPTYLEGKKNITVRALAESFPVFENNRQALATVLSEVLFLANEGKIIVNQIDNDVLIINNCSLRETNKCLK